MQPENLKQWLQWFHALEVSQVALYRHEAKSAQREVDKRMLKKAAEIEDGHVENIRASLQMRGWSPSPLAPFSLIFGSGAGSILGLNLTVALKTAIALENSAMNHYQRLIGMSDDPGLQEILWSNYLDESLHTEWFKARLESDVLEQPAIAGR